MESRAYTGDDNTTIDDLSQAELDELEQQEDAERDAFVPEEQPLTDEERAALRIGQAIADAIRKAATYAN